LSGNVLHLCTAELKGQPVLHRLY